MKAKPAERFWQETTLTPHDAGWQVFLDARPLNTPAGAVLLLPREALAEAIRQEWDAQHEQIDANTMPMFRQAVTALDRIAPTASRLLMNSSAMAIMNCYAIAPKPRPHCKPNSIESGSMFGLGAGKFRIQFHHRRRHHAH